ncbi:MAG: hypothetical protein ABSH36_04535 [Solirubrobacteraceae bacterium]
MTGNIPEATRRVRLAVRIAVVEAFVIALLKMWVAVHLFFPYLFRKDLGIPESSKIEGIDKFAAFMASLSTPLLVTLAAIAPIALIISGFFLMAGNRKAGTVIAGTIAALALAACATGLVN